MLDLLPSKPLSHLSLTLQAYLARASHFGKDGRYPKAILNCNEAIKLVPKSVRAFLCRWVLLPVWLSDWLAGCLTGWLAVSLSVYLSVCIYVCPPVCLSICLPTSLYWFILCLWISNMM